MAVVVFLMVTFPVVLIVVALLDRRTSPMEARRRAFLKTDAGKNREEYLHLCGLYENNRTLRLFAEWCEQNPDQSACLHELMAVRTKLKIVNECYDVMSAGYPRFLSRELEKKKLQWVRTWDELAELFSSMKNNYKYCCFSSDGCPGLKCSVVDLCNTMVTFANEFYQNHLFSLKNFCDYAVLEALSQKFPIFPFLVDSRGISTSGNFDPVEYDKAIAQREFEWKEAHPAPVGALLGSVLAFIHAVLCLCTWGSSWEFFC